MVVLHKLHAGQAGGGVEVALVEALVEETARVAIDRFVVGAAERGVRSAVLCNTLIYGRGLGPHEDSIQIPALLGQAKRSGVPRHVGRGLNVWSTVHIEDVADLYNRCLKWADIVLERYVQNHLTQKTTRLT